MDMFTAAGLSALMQVIAIDLVLAGNNAVVIGLAAAGLEPTQRRSICWQLSGCCLRGGPVAALGLLEMWRALRAGHGDEEGMAQGNHGGHPRRHRSAHRIRYSRSAARRAN